MYVNLHINLMNQEMGNDIGRKVVTLAARLGAPNYHDLRHG